MDIQPKKSFLKRFWWIVVIVVVIIGAVGVVVVKIGRSTESAPPLLTANFIDVSKVSRISKFRSCQGHVVVPQDRSEMTRNMKHYLILKDEYIGTRVPVYAPFDGVVKSIFARPEQGLEGEIWLGITDNDWQVSFEHILVLDTLGEGQSIKAGQLIGHVPDKGIDLVYATGGQGTTVIDGYESPFGALDSIFNHMTDQVFGEYVSEHVATRDDLIYTKAFRDANPCKLETANGAQAAQLNDHDHPEDWVYINK